MAGCGGISGSASHRAIPQEDAREPEIYFCPKDDCGTVLEKQIRSAEASVHCAFYDVDLKNVIAALSAKSKKADVRVVIDSSNNDGQIKGDGLRFDNDKQLMHNKFCVIDGKIVVTGSFNPTYNDNSRNSNNVEVVYSAILAENYEDEFSELWKGKFGEGGSVKNPLLIINGIRIESYFCPEDECASRIAELIKSADSSVYFMSFTFTSEKIADALIKKEELDVRGVIDAGQSSNKFSQLKRLNEFGIKTKKDSNKYKMHHKVFIIDNRTVITGSFNPTSSADTRNDENLLIIYDKKITRLFLKEFDRLWG